MMMASSAAMRATCFASVAASAAAGFVHITLPPFLRAPSSSFDEEEENQLTTAKKKVTPTKNKKRTVVDASSPSSHEESVVVAVAVPEKTKKSRRRRNNNGNGPEMPHTSHQQQQQQLPRKTVETAVIRAKVLTLSPVKQTWKSDLALAEAAAQHRVVPNKRFSSNQYSAPFMEWVDAVSAMISSQPSRLYRLHQSPTLKSDERKLNTRWSVILPPGASEWLDNMDEEEAAKDGGRRILSAPGDDRCTGCRRYFAGQANGGSLMDVAFYMCGCSKHRVSYCVRCRVIQWALQLTVDPETGMVDPAAGVKCIGTGCDTRWSPEDLFPVVATSAIVVPGATAATAAEREGETPSASE